MNCDEVEFNTAKLSCALHLPELLSYFCVSQHGRLRFCRINTKFVDFLFIRPLVRELRQASPVPTVNVNNRRIDHAHCRTDHAPCCQFNCVDDCHMGRHICVAVDHAARHLT